MLPQSPDIRHEGLPASIRSTLAASRFWRAVLPPNRVELPCENLMLLVGILLDIALAQNDHRLPDTASSHTLRRVYDILCQEILSLCYSESKTISTSRGRVEFCSMIARCFATPAQELKAVLKARGVPDVASFGKMLAYFNKQNQQSYLNIKPHCALLLFGQLQLLRQERRCMNPPCRKSPYLLILAYTFSLFLSR